MQPCGVSDSASEDGCLPLTASEICKYPIPVRDGLYSGVRSGFALPGMPHVYTCYVPYG